MKNYKLAQWWLDWLCSWKFYGHTVPPAGQGVYCGPHRGWVWIPFTFQLVSCHRRLCRYSLHSTSPLTVNHKRWQITSTPSVSARRQRVRLLRHSKTDSVIKCKRAAAPDNIEWSGENKQKSPYANTTNLTCSTMMGARSDITTAKK